nr:metallophosphoesterase [Frisingicoccus sp.]
MRILIVSDTHGKNGNLEKVLRLTAPLDLIFHLGDLEGSEGYIEDISPCPVHMISGNNDFFTSVPAEKIVVIGRHKIFMTHGHRYGVSYDVTRLKERAKELECDVVFFGHTHRPVIDLDEDVIAVNPGSISYPRQENRRPSYILLDIDRYGELHFALNFLEK